MTGDDFEALRPLLFSIAYRILGTVSEAEDAVQETWLRYHRTRRARRPDPDNPVGDQPRQAATSRSGCQRLGVDAGGSGLTAAVIMLSALLALALLVSAGWKLTGREDMVESHARVGVPAHRLPGLAALLAAGAVGLLAGLVWRPIGIDRIRLSWSNKSCSNHRISSSYDS